MFNIKNVAQHSVATSHVQHQECCTRFSQEPNVEQGLIAGFYLVDRGLRHRLPGFSSLGRLVVLRRVSAGSGTNGHTAVVVLRGRLPVSEVGSIVFVPIGHEAY
jgi:hypothetical protein